MALQNYDKEDYPLDILFVPDKEGGYLTESNNLSNKYRPISLIPSNIYAPISFTMQSFLSYRFSAGEFSGAEFYTKAKLSNPRSNSLSFFGRDGKIEDIIVEIFETEKGTQLQFRGDLSQKYDDPFMSDGSEYLFISMAIESTQFEKIVRMWEQNNIEEVTCSIPTEQLNGLYKLDTFAPDFVYKILVNKKMLKNHKKLPSNFTDFEHSPTYYTSKDSFSLSVSKEKVFCKTELSTPLHESESERTTEGNYHGKNNVIGIIIIILLVIMLFK